MGDFYTTLSGCFADTINCVVTVRTTGFMAGELACELAEMVYGAEFEFGLAVNKSLSDSNANGYVWLNWYVTNSDTYNAKSVWAYAIDFSEMSAPVNYAGLFNAMGGFPILTSNPATVAFDSRAPFGFGLKTGSIIGVAIQGSTGTGLNGDNAGYNVNKFDNYQFLTNCSMDYCYVGVGTTAVANFMELRGQLIAGVGQLVPSLLVVFGLFMTIFSM